MTEQSGENREDWKEDDIEWGWKFGCDGSMSRSETADFMSIDLEIVDDLIDTQKLRVLVPGPDTPEGTKLVCFRSIRNYLFDNDMEIPELEELPYEVDESIDASVRPMRSVGASLLNGGVGGIFGTVIGGAVGVFFFPSFPQGGGVQDMFDCCFGFFGGIVGVLMGLVFGAIIGSTCGAIWGSRSLINRVKHNRK